MTNEELTQMFVDMEAGDHDSVMEGIRRAKEEMDKAKGIATDTNKNNSGQPDGEAVQNS